MRISLFTKYIVLNFSILFGCTAFAASPDMSGTTKIELSGGIGGQLNMSEEGRQVCKFQPVVADTNWNFFWGKAVASDNGFRYVVDVNGKRLSGVFEASKQNNAVHTAWKFNSEQAVSVQQLGIAAEFNMASMAGAKWQTDLGQGEFPAVFGGSHLHVSKAQFLKINFPSQRVVQFSFPRPTPILIQDNRQWGQATFTLRIELESGKLEAHKEYTLSMDIACPDGVQYSRELPEFMKPVVTKSGDDWIPLNTELDIVPGSALDMTAAGLRADPCGSKGRVVITEAGHFAYSNDPKTPRRFYGVNLCYSAQFLSKERVDQLLNRFLALGYNTIRIHHYEGELTSEKPGFDWDPAKLDQLDYLMAGCAKRGIWMTTDLYVSRPVSGTQIGLHEGLLEMNKFKVLIPVYEPAFQDWAAFARKFLDRVNPYTGKRVADDPALAWISLVNEGPATLYWGSVQQIPEWTTAWNQWLAARYPTREGLAKSLGDLNATEDPSHNSVALPSDLGGKGPRSLLGQAFVGDMECKAFERMKNYLRQELKCQALLTNMNNAGPLPMTLAKARAEFDYVDEHFYVDHPSFLEKSWQLPSSSSNANPISAGAPGSSAVATSRLWGKPFTISEYNYAGPGAFRGVGGILTGAVGAIQDWDTIWRFAYSHTKANLFSPAPMGYFDLVSDPLNQAADRLALFLYLRRDLAPAPSRIALILPREVLSNPTEMLEPTALQAAVWKTRIGNLIGTGQEKFEPNTIPVPIRQGNDKEAIVKAIDKIRSLPGKDGSQGIRAEGGQLTLFPEKGTLIIDTPKSAGGYAAPGGAISAPGAGVEIDRLSTGATVFVNSLDNQPIKASCRLLVTHLTDLQNSGMRYGEAARQTLQTWGGLPYLVRNGTATVRIANANAKNCVVWALSTSGKRLEQIPAQVELGRITFTANIRGLNGARLLYEITTEPTPGAR